MSYKCDFNKVGSNRGNNKLWEKRPKEFRSICVSKQPVIFEGPSMW